MHKDHLKELLNTLQPTGRIADVQDVVDAIVYLTKADQVTCTWTAVRILANGSACILIAEQCRASAPYAVWYQPTELVETLIGSGVDVEGSCALL